MSWIVRDLWSNLEAASDKYAGMLESNKLQAFSIINQIAYEVGQVYGILLQLNFPPGQLGPQFADLGHRDLSMIVHRGREKFAPVSEIEVKEAFKLLNPLVLEQVKHSQEGFHVRLSGGRIDCLPGAIHLWCEITPPILEVLDWLFTKAYGLSFPGPSRS